MKAPIWICPCGAHNDPRNPRCEDCGKERPGETAAAQIPSAPQLVSCWRCQRCGGYTPGQPTIAGLCGTCHFDVHIRPHVSKATDICDATHHEDVPSCQDPEHAHRPPHHHVAQHIAECRTLVAKILARTEALKL